MQKFNAPPTESEIRLTRLDLMPRGVHAAARRSFLRQWGGATIAVVLPTLISAVYFLGMAADRYETQAQYVIRTAGASTGGPLQGLVQNATVMRSADDAYISHAYIQSRDAMNGLLERIDLLELLGRPPLDLLWRYPPPFREHNAERLYKRLKSHIVIDLDRNTGITTLKVQAFTPEDGRLIARVLLENTEQMINRLSERGRRDAISSAEADVETTRKAALAAQQRITEFRSRHSVIDPGKVSASAQETIARLVLEGAQIGAQVRAMQRASPNNPQIEGDKIRIAALEEQILKERQRLAGSEVSLAPLIAEYESLMLERQLTEQTFGSALAALEVARADALRQRLFLDQISVPSAPDSAGYPYRMLGIFLVLAFSLSSYLVLRHFAIDAASHDEH